MTEQALVCDLSVFTEEERNQHMSQAKHLFAKVIDLHEDKAGYALRLPDEPNMLSQLAEFIDTDRKCCAFIQFGIRIEPYNGGIYLLLQGDEDVKTAIKAELLGLLPDNL